MNASKPSKHPPDRGEMSKHLYWKGSFDVVEAGTVIESFNEWGAWGYDNSVPGMVTKTASFRDRSA